MSDALRASVEKLKQSTLKLNKVTDEAAQAVSAIEAFLNKECGVGIETYVLVRSESIDFDSDIEERTSLGYARHDGKFRIVVNVGVSAAECEEKPWVEWDRDTKLETTAKLPELINSIAAKVEERVSKSLGAVSSVVEALKPLDRKGGK